MPQTLWNNDDENGIGALFDKRGTLVFNIFLVLCIILIAWIALNNIKQQLQHDIQQSLQTVLDTTKSSVSVWLHDRRIVLQRLTNDPIIQSNIEKLLENPDAVNILEMNQEIQSRLMQFGAYGEQASASDYFMLSKDGKNLASNIESQIGKYHVIVKQRPVLLQRAFAGEVVFVPPLVSDFTIEETPYVMGTQGHAAMFFLVPITSDSQGYVAVLAIRYDPYARFSYLNRLGQIGETGESYIFDRQGFMLSESRFTQQLMEIGFMDLPRQNILSVQVRDPGVNLIEGEQPSLPRHQQPLTKMALSATNGVSSSDGQGYRDYRGVMVMGAWTWIDEFDFGITTEIDVAEAMVPYYKTRTLVILILLIITILVAMFTYIALRISERTHAVLLEANDNLEQRVTERTQELEHARRLAEDAANAKSVFLANMSHEIRTPLNAVLGYTQLLENNSELSAEEAKRLRAIKRAGTHLLGIINEILDISKIEAGAMQLVDEEFDVNLLVNDVGDMFSERCRSEGLDWKLTNHLSLPYWSKGDRQKLMQVCINIIGNAVKFTKEGAVSLCVEEKNSMIEFVIQDTGRGISEKDQPQIFKPFRQSESRSSEGTGLGLSISSKLISLMGGAISLTSQLGVGTAVTITIPLKKLEYVHGNYNPENVKVLGLAKEASLHALVVDDVEDNRYVLEQLLTDLNFDVTTACDGKDAYSVAEKTIFDVILTDIRMPVMDGIELHRSLRENKRTASIPVIAVSASSLAKNREFYLDEGFQDFIGKPFVFDEVYAVLEKVLNIQLERENTEKVASVEPLDLSDESAVDEIRIAKPELHKAIDDAEQGELSKISAFVSWIKLEYGADHSYAPLIELLHRQLSRYDMDAIATTLKTIDQRSID